MRINIVEKPMQQKVRLRDSDVNYIIESFKQHFGKDDHLWLFGSRVDLEKRGGDIDLYVETYIEESEAFSRKIKFLGNLWRGIGEQKIDIVVHVLERLEKLPIYEIAREEGVQLV